MTQYKDEVEKRREELKEVTFKDGRWERETTGFRSGRRIVKYNDKRRKDIIEWL
jgi:hypothetical protein